MGKASTPVNPTAMNQAYTLKQGAQIMMQNLHTSASTSNSNDAEKKYMQQRPLKYVGYPLFTSFLASSSEAVILRRFDQLHARVLLKSQDEIVRKEEEITSIDHILSRIETPNDHYHINGSFREDENARQKGVHMSDLFERRHTLLTELKNDIRVYDEMILNYRKLRSDPEPSKGNIKSVQRYLTNWNHVHDPKTEKEFNTGAIWQEEAEYIFKDGDLLELVPQEKPPLRRWTEKWTWFMLGWWFRKRPKGTRRYNDFLDREEVAYQSDNRIDGFITALTTLAGLGLLIVPLQVLNTIHDQQKRLNVICGLIAGFMIIMISIMPAKHWETLAATAAYSAVLMVFMQINQDSTSGESGNASNATQI